MEGFTIRLASYEDLMKIRHWLEQEASDGVDGAFFCNFNLIEAGQKSGSLLALVRIADSLPVAFCLGDDNIDILAVKADCRRQGLGRHLAQYFIEAARQRDAMGLHGECAPSSSRPFWTSIGYVSVPHPRGGDSTNWVACSLPRSFDLADGPRHTISFAIEDAKYRMTPVFQCDAVHAKGRYVLARDFVQYVPQPNPQLEIRCNGIVVFSAKNKYVQELGGERKTPWIRVREIIAR